MTDKLADRAAQAMRDALVAFTNLDAAKATMHDNRSAWPSSPSTAPGHSSDIGDPTGNAVSKRDHGGGAIRDLERHLDQLTSHAEALVTLIAGWTPRRPDDAARVSTASDPGMLCEYKACNKPSRNKNPTDVGGRLSHPKVLCSSHYAFICRTQDPRP